MTRFSAGVAGSSSGSNNNKRRNNTITAADKIVAATAGQDTWKTWAGRKHGSENFEMMDLFRGMKRSFHHTFLSGPPPSGTACPVCFCEPERPEDWHVTWCGHAVCIDCLQQYASNQVQDKEHSGPLKCPVCPQVLRRQDAVVAFGENTELIHLWDQKIRNQLLRALPSYRSCPKCSNNKNHNQNNSEAVESSGGGFVTPECLQPHYNERREAATRLLRGRGFVILAIFFGYCLVISVISKTPSQYPSVDLFFMLVPIYVFVKAALAAQHWLAHVARQHFFRPITVECPCCNEAFILPAESSHLQDDETSRWMDAHSRKCPSCSVPIMKTGGCNHMRCTHCRADFCWACMRLRTSCKAYQCVNGAPYKNAVPGFGDQDGPRAPQANDSILTVIDYLLERSCPQLTYRDGALLVVCLFARFVGPVQYIVNIVMAILSSVIVSQMILGGAILFVLNTMHRNVRLGVLQEGRQRHAAGNLDGVRPNHLNRRQIRRMEQEMVAEALRRSMEEM
mmetsp:Transcript_731/g.1335  ORF Transcript_731/g.1335 Transcript_731/m.1335 type:complete len:509 (-) Transcript_731:1892-3418(-)